MVDIRTLACGRTPQVTYRRIRMGEYRNRGTGRAPFPRPFLASAPAAPVRARGRRRQPENAARPGERGAGRTRREPENAARTAESGAGRDRGKRRGPENAAPPDRRGYAPRRWPAGCPMPDRRTVAAVFAGGALGTLARAALARRSRIRGAVAVADVRRQHRRRLPARLLRHPAAGAAAAVQLPAARCSAPACAAGCPRSRRCRWRSQDARRGRRGLALGYAAASVAAGYAAIQLATALVRRVRVRRMSVLLWAGVGRDRRARRGGSGSCVDGAVAAGRALPARHAGRQPVRRGDPGPARPGSPSATTRRCWPARPRSARTRRSRPGCSRPSG